ncbi:MAG: hypothetical protein AB9869_17305 [Verrucomicrobiia bacterium]
MSGDVFSVLGMCQALVGAFVLFGVGWASGPARAAVAPSAAAQTNVIVSIPNEGDLLQFADGSALHGQLQSMTTASGVGWKHPDVKSLIEFRPTNIAWIRFAKPTPVSAASEASCRFRFHNGDEVFGRLSSMRDDRLELDSWFNGALETSREMLQSVTFLSKGFTILYEGPSGPEGWIHGKTARAWEYRDGALIATGAGTLGRDFGLTRSGSVSFDLAWNGHFSLILALYTQVLDRFDYSSSSYMFYLSPGYISLQRVQGGAGAMNLGQTAISEMSRKNRLHLEIRANKEDNTLGLLVDDRLVQRWKDSAGFVGRGSGIVFFAQLDGPSIKITNLKVSQWEGSSALETLPGAPSKDDVVHLVNRDRVTGRLRGLQDGILSVEAGGTPLEIPLSRVNQISFAASQTNAPPPDPWHVRASFAGGGSVAFRLGEWTQGRAIGSSPNFGPVDLDARYIRQLQFNLHRPRLAGMDMEITDQDIWDLE